MRDVSDTALLTAEMRAIESARPDRLFDDPYAATLAGDRARQIAPLRRRMVSPGGVIARTVLLDDTIRRLIERDGIGLVINLGAGLDTRPYRLTLPSDLSWVEIDLPGIVDYKTETLAGERAQCHLERFGIDLANTAVRRSTIANVMTGRPTLVVSEGVVPYLRPDDVDALATELASYRQVRFWCLDLTSPAGMRWGNRFGGRKLAAAQSRAQFAPVDGADHFRQLGWDPVEVRSVWLEQRRLGREPRPMRLAWSLAPARLRRSLEDILFLVLLQRS